MDDKETINDLPTLPKDFVVLLILTLMALAALVIVSFPSEGLFG